MRSHVSRYSSPSRCFYVDATGGGANSGNGENNALQTIAHVNALKLRPGDRVLFKRGETFSDIALLLAYSGRAGRPVTFSSYGSGVRPILAPNNDRGIEDNGTVQRHVHITGLDCAPTGTAQFGAIVRLKNSYIGDCIFRDAVEDGLYLYEGCDWILVDGIECKDNGNSGCMASAAVDPPDNITVRNSSFHDNGVSVTADHGLYAHDGNNIHFIKCVSYNNSGGGYKFNGCNYSSIVDCKSYGNGTGIFLGAAAGLSCNYNLFYNNEIRLNNGTGIQFNDSADVGSNYNEFYFNSIVANGKITGGTAGIYFFQVGAPSTGNIFKNNIVFGDNALHGTGSWVLRFADTTLRQAQTFDYNLLLRDGNAQIVYDATDDWTFAEWQGLGHEANGATGDPLFATEYTDVHLQAESPADGTGLAIAGILRDLDNVTRTDPPDIGCYQYV